MNDLLTSTEAARVARVSPKTILRHADRGAFPAVRVGTRSVRIPREPFMCWLFGPDWASFAGDA